MTGKAIGLSFNYGFVGNVSRTPDCVIESKSVKSDSADISFGSVVILNTDNSVSAPASVTPTAANVAGIAVAEVKQFSSYPTTTDGAAGVYKANQPCDIIQRGIVMVKPVHGTPTAGGAVYVRTALNGTFPSEVVGDLRADSDTTNTVQLTNMCWNTGLVDGNGVTELKIKSINN